jgi:putative endonuclease
MNKPYFVFIMSNVAKMMYVGVTNDLDFRVFQHKTKQVDGYTSSYNLFKLVYFETFGDIRAAIAREKQIKGWLRAKKIALIESMNPHWNDLAKDRFKKPSPPQLSHQAKPCHPECIRRGCAKDLNRSRATSRQTLTLFGTRPSKPQRATPALLGLCVRRPKPNFHRRIFPQHHITPARQKIHVNRSRSAVRAKRHRHRRRLRHQTQQRSRQSHP